MIDLIDSVKKHEGYRSKPYLCTAGKLTIGYGRNLDDRGISKDEAELMLSNDLMRCEKEARSFGWYHSLNSQRKDVIVEMIFNLGLSRFMKFKKMIKAISEENYSEAAAQMLDSVWASQVGQRAITLSDKMRG